MISHLQPSDSIILIAPARKISFDEIKQAITVFTSWGLQVIESPNLYQSDNQYSGTIEQRVADMQWALDHEVAKAIICVRGGYGSVQLIDTLDFSKFRIHPKWLVGYSDITVFHNHINQQLNISTLHATMPINFENHTFEAQNSLYKALFEKSIFFQLPNVEKLPTQRINSSIVGGNLSIIYSLLGSNSALKTDGKILFLEDLDEYLYHIERMMYNLQRNGLLTNLQALIIGGMTDLHDNTIPFGKDYKAIIKTICAPYDYPIIFDFPAGHIDDNRAIIFNQSIILDITEKYITIQ